MSYTSDLSETNVFESLRAFILSVLGAAVNDVVRIPANRVPMPKKFPFITMTERFRSQIHWPMSSITEATIQEEKLQLGIDYEIQVDVYGPNAGDLAQILYGVFMSANAYDIFASVGSAGVRPLYADLPRQNSIVDGEAEYELRWMLPLHLQYNPTIKATIQTAATVTVGTITNVEAAYS